MSSNKTIIKNTIFLYTRLIFILFVSLYTTREILSALGVVDYGIYNVVAGFVSMFAFLNTSMINSIQRFYNYEKGKGSGDGIRAVYNMSIRIQVLIGIITLVLLEVIGVWYINSKMVVPADRLLSANCVFQFSSFSLLLVILQIPYSAAIVSYERMDYFALVGIFDAIVKLVVAISLPYATSDKLILYGFFMFLISVMNFLMYFIYSRYNFKELSFEKGFNKQLFLKLSSFSGWNLFDTFAFVVQGQGLNLLMNSFFGPVVNAARGIAYQIQSTIYSFSSNLSTAFKPQLVESYAQLDLSRTKSLFYSMSKACFFMQYILSVPIILNLEYIFSIWLGSNIPEHTLSFTKLVLINTIINSFNMPMSQVVQATGEIKIYQVLRSLILTLVLPLSYFAVKFYCIPEVVFYAVILITILLQPLSLLLLHRVFKFRYKDYLKRVTLPCVFCAFLIWTLTVLITNHLEIGFTKLMSTIIIVVLVSVFLGLTVMLSKDERYLVYSFIKKKFSNSILNKIHTK